MGKSKNIGNEISALNENGNNVRFELEMITIYVLN